MRLWILLILLIVVLMSSIVLAESNRVYLLDMHYDNGEISLKELRIKSGHSPDGKTQSGNYKLKVISFGNSQLYSFDFNAPRIYVDISDPFSGQLNGGVVDLKEADFTLIAPYFNDGKDIKIYKEDNEIFSTDISQFSVQLSPKRSFAWLYISLAILFIALIIFFIIKKRNQ